MLDVLSQTGNIIEIARKAYDVSKKAGLVDLQEAIVSLREYTAELREEILRLREELKAKDEALKQRDNLVYHDQMYWIEDGGKRDGPFCQPCHDARDKLIRLFSFDNDDYWRCKECGHLLER